MNEYNKTFTDVVLACALFYQQNSDADIGAISSGSHFQNITKALHNFYRLIAEIEGETLGGWEADKTHAGWLLQNRYPVFIRVPAHLAALFPTTQYLDELFSVSSRVRTSSKSIVCISGSNSVKNILDIVDDIDFCEYIPFTSDDAIGAVMQKISQDEDVICRLVKVNSESFAPDKDKPEKISLALSQVDPSSPSCSTFKLDYVVRLPDKRAYDASSVMIACDSDFRSAGFQATFAHQEVHISASDTVPIELDNVMELGRYTVWLLSQVEKYKREDNIAKMLKRALSLTRVCWMQGYTSEIADLFSRTTFLIDREIQTISEMRKKLDGHISDSKWADAHSDLNYYEEIALLEKKKLEIIQKRHFPKGADANAKELCQRIVTDCVSRSRGGLRL